MTPRNECWAILIHRGVRRASSTGVSNTPVGRDLSSRYLPRYFLAADERPQLQKSLIFMVPGDGFKSPTNGLQTIGRASSLIIKQLL